jgi:hypothetical protein
VAAPHGGRTCRRGWGSQRGQPGNRPCSVGRKGRRGCTRKFVQIEARMKFRSQSKRKSHESPHLFKRERMLSLVIYKPVRILVSNTNARWSMKEQRDEPYIYVGHKTNRTNARGNTTTTKSPYLPPTHSLARPLCTPCHPSPPRPHAPPPPAHAACVGRGRACVFGNTW